MTYLLANSLIQGEIFEQRLLPRRGWACLAREQRPRSHIPRFTVRGAYQDCKKEVKVEAWILRERQMYHAPTGGSLKRLKRSIDAAPNSNDRRQGAYPRCVSDVAGATRTSLTSHCPTSSPTSHASPRYFQANTLPGMAGILSSPAFDGMLPLHKGYRNDSLRRSFSFPYNIPYKQHHTSIPLQAHSTPITYDLSYLERPP